MEQRINVLVGWDLAADLLERIDKLDPQRVRLLNREAPPLKPSPELWPPFPDDLLSLLAEADVLFTLRVPRDLLDHAPKLRWIQSQAAGVDAIISRRLLESDIVITTASGTHATPFGETVLGAILALAKGFPQAMRRQARHEWLRYTPEEVSGATVGIVGGGHIGTGVAERCKALGMRVIATRRSVTAERGSEPPYDLLLPASQLDRLLAESDYVVVSAPRTPETRGIIGREQFQRMKPGARFINIARGDLVDEEALIGALQSGHLAGAYLDVFATEPLPPESPLWDMPNVLLTSHAGGGSPHYQERVVEIFLDNLRRYLDGLPLRNVFDRERGY